MRAGGQGGGYPESVVIVRGQVAANEDAIFVHGLRKKRPYTYPVDSRVTMGFDCLFRGLEITNRQPPHQRVQDAAGQRADVRLEAGGLADYLSIFESGCPPHGGFVIGLERLTQKVLGLANVKEACLFPRDRRRVRPSGLARNISHAGGRS